MSASLLIISIISYILSLVISLVLMIFSKKISDGFKKGIIIIHSAFLVVYLFSVIFFKTNSGIIFLSFFCSGIAVSGMILRSRLNLFLKIYYSVFLLSLILFLYSPSFLFSLLARQKFPGRHNTEFLLTGNYYLIKEKSMLEVSGAFARYKIVRRSGTFNKTMQRDISFHHEIDSIRVLKFTDEKEAAVRGYFISENKTTDSADISADLKMKDENEITIHRKN